MAVTAMITTNPFIKQLAANDRTTRDRAVSSIRTYLRRSTPFAQIEFLKLWKGLFYCMWMSDKPRTQQRLAVDLGELVDVLSKDNFAGFIRAFWQTIAREWSGIDALRMDKYLYLIRCYVNAGFRYVARQSWQDHEMLVEYLQILKDVPLNARDPKVPNGLRHHMADVYIDELDKVDQDAIAPLDEVLQPLRSLGKKTPTKSVRKRVEQGLDEERVRNWKQRNHDAGGNVEQVVREKDLLTAGTHPADGDLEDEPEDDVFSGFDD